MKLICLKSDLTEGVNIVSKAVPSKTTMSILECILIDASSDEIKLIANDMKLGIETKVKGSVEEKGIVALDAGIFREIVRKLPDNEVVIETDSSFRTAITCEKSYFNIAGRSGEDFSYLPYIEKNDSISISEYTLKEVVRQTVFSVSDNENNKMMMGELFEIQKNKLRVSSLDGHRISIRNIELKEIYDNRKVIVPGKALQEVSRILPGEVENTVNIFFKENHILFEFLNTKVVSRLIEGKYFNIDQMLSSDYEVRVKANKKKVLDCMERAVLLVSEEDRKPVIMDIKDGYMKLNITSLTGSMNEKIEDIKKEGEDIMIGFNPKYFSDALRVIDDEEVTFYMISAKAPCFIKDEEENYIYVILPVNFNVPSR